MAISVDWATGVISVPKADMLLVQSSPTEIRELDLDAFRLDLKALEAGEYGMAWPDTHSHNPPVTVGGVTLARVIEIINGYTVTFEDGQYAVNLVGANSNVGDVTNVNQVSIRSANSAGLTYSKEIEDQSFIDARVWIDVDNGATGTQFPLGTPGSPVNNLADAQAIIAQRVLPKRLGVVGTLVVGASDTLQDYDILGASERQSEISLTSGANTMDTVMRDVKITGTASGGFDSFATELASLSGVAGVHRYAILDGTITLADPADKHEFIDAVSDTAGVATPTLDCNSLDNLDAIFRRYAGGIEVQNYTGAANSITIDLTSGHIILDSTCTAGTIVCRGVGKLTDNSGVGCTVEVDGLLTRNSIALSVWDELLSLHSTSGSAGETLRTLEKIFTNDATVAFNGGTGENEVTIFDDDGITVLRKMSITTDGLTRTVLVGS